MSPVNKEKNIKEDLLVAAGQILAVRGYAGTSIREIINQAGATLSSVNYYFGSKDQLYLETIRYVLDEKIDVANLFRRYNQTKTKTKQEISNRLGEMIRELFYAFFGVNPSAWYGQFLARAILESRTESNRLILELVNPSILEFEKVLHAQLPHVPEITISLFCPCLFGQIYFFAIAKEIILMSHGIKQYTPDYLRETIFHIARNMILPLGLPTPKEKIEKE